MKYEYSCTSCPLTIRSDTRADSLTCPSCSQLARRVWGFAFQSPFREGYNPALGQHVSSRQQLESGFAMATERANQTRHNVDAQGNVYEVTPAPVDYKPIDMRDKEALGVTNDGLDSTYDALKRAGRDDQARRLKALIDD